MTKLICAGMAVLDTLAKPVDRTLFDADAVYPEEYRTMLGG